LTIGILADPVACPDAKALAGGIDRCFAELVTAVPHPDWRRHHPAEA